MRALRLNEIQMIRSVLEWYEKGIDRHPTMVKVTVARLRSDFDNHRLNWKQFDLIRRLGERLKNIDTKR